jgi:hypothetical protein
LRSGGLDSQRTSCEFLAVQRPQRSRSVVLIGHLDKSEAARAPVETVTHYLGSLHCADLGKCFTQIAIAQGKTQVPYE